jgi:hypothetical protein
MLCFHLNMKISVSAAAVDGLLLTSIGFIGISY